MSIVDGWVLEGCSGAVGRNGLRADQVDSPARTAGVLADSPLRYSRGSAGRGVVVFLMGVQPARIAANPDGSGSFDIHPRISRWSWIRCHLRGPDLVVRSRAGLPMYGRPCGRPIPPPDRWGPTKQVVGWVQHRAVRKRLEPKSE